MLWRAAEVLAPVVEEVVSPSVSMRGMPIDEFRANTFNTYTQSAPSVESFGDGLTVVVWQSQYQEAVQNGGGWNWGVYGQVFGPKGSPLGDEFLINTYTESNQGTPAIATLDDGGFIVTWYDDSGHSGGSSYDIRGQRFNSSGEVSGNEFLINTEVSGTQTSPAVSSLNDGGFVVTWRDDNGSSHGGSGYDIRAQRFDVNSDPAGTEFLVNATQVSGNQYDPAVIGLKEGGFVVTWRDDDGVVMTAVAILMSGPVSLIQTARKLSVSSG